VILYLSFDQLVAIHEMQLETFGGLDGLRDRGSLESAVARPAMTFGGEDLYPDMASKAAALMESLVMNHPFVDGNKRVGAAAAELFLEVNELRLLAADKEFEEITLALASGKVPVEKLTIWFRQRIRPIE